MKTNQRITALALLVALFTSSLTNAQSVFKKKWNPEAQGVAIGAGVGGAAGAIINKRNRVLGAGIGMAAGAAAGYGVGKVISNRHKRAAAAARAAEDREYAARTANNRELRSGTANRTARHSATNRATARASAPVAAYASAQPSVLEQPASVTIPLVRNGYLLNTAYGDPNSAYPNSEYRRKSW